MIISTTPSIEGKQVSEVLGIARGNTVRSRNAARDIFAALKNVVGGEIDEYTKLQAQAREQAISRMKDDAESLGADAVEAEMTELDVSWLKRKLKVAEIDKKVDFKKMTKIVSGKKLWNYDNLEPTERKGAI